MFGQSELNIYLIEFGNSDEEINKYLPMIVLKSKFRELFTGAS